MAANKLTTDEIIELRYFWHLGAKPLDLSKAYGISPEATYAHTTYKQRRDEYREKYYSSESTHVREQRNTWKRSPKGVRCVKNTQLKSSYGITLSEYEMKLAEQRGNCAICERPASIFKKGLHVDHNHKTGKIRGLLCTNCNTRLVASLEDPLLDKAKAYLQGWD